MVKALTECKDMTRIQEVFKIVFSNEKVKPWLRLSTLKTLCFLQPDAFFSIVRFVLFTRTYNTIWVFPSLD